MNECNDVYKVILIIPSLKFYVNIFHTSSFEVILKFLARFVYSISDILSDFGIDVLRRIVVIPQAWADLGEDLGHVQETE